MPAKIERIGSVRLRGIFINKLHMHISARGAQGEGVIRLYMGPPLLPLSTDVVFRVLKSFMFNDQIACLILGSVPAGAI